MSGKLNPLRRGDEGAPSTMCADGDHWGEVSVVVRGGVLTGGLLASHSAISTEDIRTQSIREPKHGVAGKEQHALARVMTWSDASYLVIAFAGTTVHFGIHICFTIRGSTISRPGSAPAALVVATRLVCWVL